MPPIEKPASTSVPVHELIRNRWSPRSFADRAVPPETLTAILEAGRWAASSNNAQPWRFIVATRQDPAALAAAVGCFNARNQRWTRTAPVLVKDVTGRIPLDTTPSHNLAHGCCGRLMD